jgi:hypothetical protein
MKCYMEGREIAVKFVINTCQKMCVVFSRTFLCMAATINAVAPSSTR